VCAYKVRARYDDQPHAHLAIAVQGPTSYDSESIALVVAQMILGTWNRTDGAGVNLASKMAAACAEFGAAHSYEAFFHKYSDTSLWSDLCSLLIHVLQSLIFVFRMWVYPSRFASTGLVSSSAEWGLDKLPPSFIGGHESTMWDTFWVSATVAQVQVSQSFYRFNNDHCITETIQQNSLISLKATVAI